MRPPEKAAVSIFVPVSHCLTRFNTCRRNASIVNTRFICPTVLRSRPVWNPIGTGYYLFRAARGHRKKSIDTRRSLGVSFFKTSYRFPISIKYGLFRNFQPTNAGMCMRPAETRKCPLPDAPPRTKRLESTPRPAPAAVPCPKDSYRSFCSGKSLPGLHFCDSEEPLRNSRNFADLTPAFKLYLPYGGSELFHGVLDDVCARPSGAVQFAGVRRS